MFAVNLSARRQARSVAAGYPMLAILRDVDRAAIFVAEAVGRLFAAELAVVESVRVLV